MKFRWKRVLIWGVVAVLGAVLIAAGSFYLWFNRQVAASNDRVDPAIIQVLRETTTTASAVAGGPTTTGITLPESPSSMNIVLVGYDRRAGGSAEVTEGRSDTIIIVHVDPDKDFISLLSVPRDTLADVPGHGLYKINAAWAFGGGALLIRTIQSVLGVDLDHYVAVDLEAFKAITSTLGGVYMDVDRRYLNDSESWEHLDLQPGYQLLDAADTLDYVRFRHDDNIDFGRMARQQQFLTAVREQALGWNLPFKIPSLVKGLFSNLDTDLGANELIKLAYWVMKLDGGRIKQAQIRAKTGLIHGIFYVQPTPEELAAAVMDLYTPPGQASLFEAPATTTAGAPAAAAVAAVLKPADLARIRVEVVNGTGRVGQGALAALWLSRQGARVIGVAAAEAALPSESEVRYPAGRSEAAAAVAGALGITRLTEADDVERVTAVLSASYLIAGNQLTGPSSPVLFLSDWQRLMVSTTLPLSAPTYLPEGFTYGFQRAYDIVRYDKDKTAVRVGYRLAGEDQYLGVSESAWLDAPLASPGVKVQENGVTYTVVGSSTRADHVWWIQDGILHWVTNTLFADLDREQLLAVAISMRAVPRAME